MTLAARTFPPARQAMHPPTEDAVAVHEILFPSDLSPASDRAFDHAHFLAERLGARLTLFHAVDTAHLSEAREAGDPEVARRLARAARSHLDRHTTTLTTQHRIVVEQSNQAAQALLAQIRATHPDLVVMATHGREGLAHFFLGSVTERILEVGGSPVLCVREPDHGVALPYRRILVPVDLTETSRLAFPLAALLARTFDAEVLAIHVAQVKAGSLNGISALIEETVPSEERLGQFLEPEFAGLRVRARVEIGSPWDRIVETALLDKADVIVLSTHGADSLTDRILGSRAERIVRQSPCPVLVV
ncbi:MAG TPA: universal stress protein [Vicinamibacteria bacterium]|nr:universal stress protein [Vicinamibacteria bacterium]